MEDGDWELINPNPTDEIITYRATGAGEDGASLTILGPVPFDLDFNPGQEIKIVGNVIHLPEGAFPGKDENPDGPVG